MPERKVNKSNKRPRETWLAEAEKHKTNAQDWWIAAQAFREKADQLQRLYRELAKKKTASPIRLRRIEERELLARTNNREAAWKSLAAEKHALTKEQKAARTIAQALELSTRKKRVARQMSKAQGKFNRTRQRLAQMRIGH